jgi:cytochrome P450
MSTRIMDEAAKVFADPVAYTDEAGLHAALSHLRANAAVSWVEAPNYRPFWAMTKHADIMEIERANTVFTNSPRPVLITAEADDLHAAAGVRTLIHLDDPQHRVVRAIGADWFRPKAMRALKTRVDELARIYVDKMLAAGTVCDFVSEVAVNYPLYVILSLLGLPESDFPRLLRLTQELFGNRGRAGRAPRHLHRNLRTRCRQRAGAVLGGESGEDAGRRGGDRQGGVPAR